MVQTDRIDIRTITKATLAVVRGRIRPLLALTLGYFGTFIALLLTTFTVDGMAPQDEPAAVAGAGMALLILTALIASQFLLLIYVSASVLVCSERDPVGLNEALRKAVRRLPSLVAGLVLAAFCIAGSAFVFAIALAVIVQLLAPSASEAAVAVAILVMGAIVGLRLSMLLPVTVVEGVGNPVKAVARSWKLTSGHGIRLTLVFLANYGGMVLVVGGVATLAEAGNSYAGAAGFLTMALAIPSFSIYSVALLAVVHERLAPREIDAIRETFA